VGGIWNSALQRDKWGTRVSLVGDFIPKSEGIPDSEPSNRKLTQDNQSKCQKVEVGAQTSIAARNNCKRILQSRKRERGECKISV